MSRDSVQQCFFARCCKCFRGQRPQGAAMQCLLTPDRAGGQYIWRQCSPQTSSFIPHVSRSPHSALSRHPRSHTLLALFSGGQYYGPGEVRRCRCHRSDLCGSGSPYGVRGQPGAGPRRCTLSVAAKYPEFGGWRSLCLPRRCTMTLRSAAVLECRHTQSDTQYRTRHSRWSG